MCISAKYVRSSLPHVDLEYVLIRFKELNDLSLEQLVIGNVQATIGGQPACLGTDLARSVVLAMVK